MECEEVRFITFLVSNFLFLAEMYLHAMSKIKCKAHDIRLLFIIERQILNFANN